MSRMKGATQGPGKDNDKSQEIHAIMGKSKQNPDRRNSSFADTITGRIYYMAEK